MGGGLVDWILVAFKRDPIWALAILVMSLQISKVQYIS
jgi:hypothetical protein